MADFSTNTGFPDINYASGLRGTYTIDGPRRISQVLPRRKYTYIVEFQINPNALDSGVTQTNLKSLMDSGRLYVPLKSVTHPTPTYKVETLRRYNKYIKLPTKIEFEGGGSMVFQDDDTSIAVALWKEYMTWYTYAGDVGSSLLGGAAGGNLNSSFRDERVLLGDPTADIRQNMNTRPSVGMTLRQGVNRHFFDRIVIYDLGSEPDSINIYYYVHPVITTFNHHNLDTFDRNGTVDIEVAFAYENYYFILGQNIAVASAAVQKMFGFDPGEAIPVYGHATQNVPQHSGSTSNTTQGFTGNAAPFDNSPITRTPLPGSDTGATNSAAQNTQNQYGTGQQQNPSTTQGSNPNDVNTQQVRKYQQQLDQMSVQQEQYQRQIDDLDQQIAKSQDRGDPAAFTRNLINQKSYKQTQINALNAKLGE